MKHTHPIKTQVAAHHRGIQVAGALALALGLLWGLLLLPIAATTLLPTTLPAFTVEPAYAQTGGITVTKTGPVTVTRGDFITYTLTVTNSEANYLFSDIFIFDTTPTGTDCESTYTPPGWGSDCSDAGAGITRTLWYPLGSPFNTVFTDGTTVILTMVVRLDDYLPDGFDIVNDDYGAYVDNDPDPVIGTPTITTTLNSAGWEIGKTVSSDTTQAGGLLTYTLTVTNNGSVPTSGVYTITDTLPDYTSFDSASPVETGKDTNSVWWEFSDPLGVGQTRSVTFTVQVDGSLPEAETAIVNDTYAVMGGSAATAAGSPITSTAQAEAILSINKIAATDPITVGEILTYTITVANSSSSTGPAAGVVISDILPAELTYRPGTAIFLDGVPGSVDDSGNPLVWTLTDTIDVNDTARVQFAVDVTETVPDSGLITNTYEASTDNAAEVSRAMDVEVIPGPAAGGTLVVDSPIENLCETTVATATVTDKSDGTGNPVPGVPVRIAPFLGDGDVAPDSLEGTTNASGIFTATFQGIVAGEVTLATQNLDTDVIFDSVLLTINEGSPIPTAIIVTVSPPGVATGEASTVTAEVTDCRSDPVDSQTVTFTVDSLANFSGMGTTTASTSDGFATITVTADITPGMSTITGTVAGPLHDTDTLNIGVPNLDITKSAAPGGGEIAPGETLTYSVIVENSGAVTVTAVTITDALDNDVGFVSGSLAPGGALPTNDNGTLTFSATNLGVGNYLTATIVVTVTSTVSGTEIANTATVGSDQTGDTDSNEIRLTVTVDDTPKVFLPIVLKE